MGKIDNALSSAFGVAPLATECPPVPVTEHPEAPDNPTEDFEFVRNKLHALLVEGTSAFECLAQIAKTEEKVSAFGTLNEMLNNLSDISIKLLDIQEKKQKLTGKTSVSGAQPQIASQTNNIAFIGSSTQLDDMINNNPQFREMFGEVIDVEEEPANS